MIKGVTFDLWNTLFCDSHYCDLRIDVLKRVLDMEDLLIDRHIIETEYLSAMRHFDDLWKKRRDKQYMSAAKLMKSILRNLDVELSTSSKSTIIKGFEEAILEDPPPLVNGSKAVMKSLHGNYQIGLISNTGITSGRLLRRVLRHRRMLQYFTCTIFSDEIGYTKPHPIIFRKAVEELKVNVDEIVHIGDLLETDIAGANTFGMKTIWFNKSDRARQEASVTPDYEINDLTELLKILG